MGRHQAAGRPSRKEKERREKEKAVERRMEKVLAASASTGPTRTTERLFRMPVRHGASPMAARGSHDPQGRPSRT